jgi:hypothetical protein
MDGQLDLNQLVFAFRYSTHVPRSNLLMLYKEIIAVIPEIRAKPVNALCDQEERRVG